jgi:hypothetical protein
MHFYSVITSNILDIRQLGPQLLKKFLSVHGFRRFITVFTRVRLLSFREPYEINSCSAVTFNTWAYVPLSSRKLISGTAYEVNM